MRRPPSTALAATIVALALVVAPIAPGIAAGATTTGAPSTLATGAQSALATGASSTPATEAPSVTTGADAGSNVDVIATVIPEGVADAGLYRYADYDTASDQLTADDGNDLVLTISADGLNDRVESRDGPLDERVLATLEDEYDFAIRQTEATTLTSHQQIEFDLNASSVDVVRPDVLGADRYHLVVDLDAVAPVDAAARETDPLGGDEVTGPRFVAVLASADGDATARSATLNLVPRTVPTALDEEGSAVAALPATYDLENATPDDLAARFRAEQDEVVVRSDETLALAVRIDGLDRRVDTVTGSFDERVLAVLDGTGNLTVQQDSESTPVQVDPASLWVNASVVDAARGSTPDTYVLLVDADAVAATSFENDDETLLVPDGVDPSALGWLYDDDTVTPSFRAYTDGFESQAFTFDRRPASNATVDVWRVPHYVDVAGANATEIASHRTVHAADEAVGVTPRDRLAVDVSVPGLDASVAERDGNLSERVLAALQERGSFAVVQTQETTPPELRQSSLWLNASNVRAVEAPGPDRYILVVDPGELAAARVDYLGDDANYPGDFASVEEYRRVGLYEVDWNLREFTARYYANDSSRGLAATSRPVAFQREVAAVDVDGPLAPDAEVDVAGSTTVAPGTVLVVTASGDDGAVLDSTQTAVRADGTFATTLDLSGAATPTNASLEVAYATHGDDPGAELAVDPASVRVLEPDATVTFEDQTTSTQYVTAQANLSHGGVLVLWNETEVVDVSNSLAPGADQTVTFTLDDASENQTLSVVAFRPGDGEGGQPYPDGVATARITVEPNDGDDQTTTIRTTTTSRTTTSTTDGGTTTASTTDATTTTAGTTNSTQPPSDDPIPGFGPLAALTGILASVLVALRRRRET